MSHDNLPYIVEVHIIYGSDKRIQIDYTPWKNIENEIDNYGNINLFSRELLKLIPSTENGEDCEVYAAKLIKKPAARSEYIRYLLREYDCMTYQEYCDKTSTPPPKLNRVFVFDSGNINKDIEQMLTQPIVTKQFKTKNTRSNKKVKIPILTESIVESQSSKKPSTRIVSFTSNARGDI